MRKTPRHPFRAAARFSSGFFQAENRGPPRPSPPLTQVDTAFAVNEKGIIIEKCQKAAGSALEIQRSLQPARVRIPNLDLAIASY